MRSSMLAAFLCFALAPLSAHAAEGGGALDAFRSAHTEVTELVAADAAPAAIEAEVDALLDYDWLAKAALGGPSHYAERCAERCAEFEALFSALIRANYLRGLRQQRDARVEYLGEEVRERATKVDTKLSFTRKGKPTVLEVDYVMHEIEGRWQVRDIITEDVSLVKNYRHEIHVLYKRGGIAEVLAALEAKLDAPE